VWLEQLVSSESESGTPARREVQMECGVVVGHSRAVMGGSGK
jgi:hypothetical protein